MLIRWITKPQGMAGLGAHACGSPAMPAAHVAANPFNGSYGTRVFGTTGRPEGRGGGTD